MVSTLIESKSRQSTEMKKKVVQQLEVMEEDHTNG